jgi:hypothetical protein
MINVDIRRPVALPYQKPQLNYRRKSHRRRDSDGGLVSRAFTTATRAPPHLSFCNMITLQYKKTPLPTPPRVSTNRGLQARQDGERLAWFRRL